MDSIPQSISATSYNTSKMSVSLLNILNAATLSDYQAIVNSPNINCTIHCQTAPSHTTPTKILLLHINDINQESEPPNVPDKYNNIIIAQTNGSKIRINKEIYYYIVDQNVATLALVVGIH